jgi:hypothetical protein
MTSPSEAPPAPPRPKLRRAERRPDPGRWASVVPPALAELVAGTEAADRHRDLVARVEAAAIKLAELKAAETAAAAKDRQAEGSFAEGRRRTLAPAAVPEAQAAVEQAQRELEVLERQLPASADALFAEAYPQLEQAKRQLERRLDEEDSRVEEHVAEALAALDERAELGRQLGWIERGLWETSLAPYDGRRRPAASTPAAASLREIAAQLRYQRDEAARRRHERAVEVEMLFNPDRSPKRPDGRPLATRRREAEQAVLARESR